MTFDTAIKKLVNICISLPFTVLLMSLKHHQAQNLSSSDCRDIKFQHKSLPPICLSDSPIWSSNHQPSHCTWTLCGYSTLQNFLDFSSSYYSNCFLLINFIHKKLSIQALTKGGKWDKFEHWWFLFPNFWDFDIAECIIHLCNLSSLTVYQIFNISTKIFLLLQAFP